MFLVVGLGNPGLNYAYTRHSVGFMCVDHLSYALGFPEFKEKFDSLYTDKIIESTDKIFIQKPQTFMNLSGRAVAQIVSFYKIPSQNVFVIHDDLDINPLKIKIKFGGSSGGHNGIRDIDKAIGNEYWRIRIGIGRPPIKTEVANYVLSMFYQDEITNLIPKVFDPLSKHIEKLLLAEDKSEIIDQITKLVNG